MQFADPRASATAYLILRHLYDGDVIEWPIADDHPLREVFAQLEAQGFVARWDRVWPLSDRYRLTEQGIATIEAVYRPAGSEAFFEGIRQKNLAPADRRAYLQSQGLDPGLWPILHDPSTHWTTFVADGSRYHGYLWEDQLPVKRKRRSKPLKPSGGRAGGGPPVVRHHHHHHHDRDPHVVPYVVDLDREAGDAGQIAPMSPDVDVS